MNVEASECPTDQQFHSLLADTCSHEDRAWLTSHLDTCPACCERLDRIAKSDWTRLMPADRQVEVATASFVLNSEAVDTELSQSAPVRTSSLPCVPGYEVESLIGRGGMGYVYRAQQTSLNRPVALKVLSGTATENPDRWWRFQTEIEAIGRLQHPHIVRVFDAGEHNGLAFVSQELCDADSLQVRIGTPQSPQQVAQILQQLSSAVAHAHAQGVLHRDIKPSNILTLDGTVKLADFGLAKLTDTDDTLTQTRDIMGSPSYMAPEQARADHAAIGPQTDIFQLGVVMYELLTGVAPFRGDSLVETLRMTEDHVPVSPRKLQPAVPRDLQTICLKCIAKRPPERYGSADDLAADLNRFLSGHPIHAKPVGPIMQTWKWMRRYPMAASLCVVSVTAVLTLLGLWASFTAELANQQAAQDRQGQYAHAESAELQEDLALEKEAGEATSALLTLLTGDALETAKSREGKAPGMLAVLQAAAESIEQQYEDRPAVLANTRLRLGQAYLKLDLPKEALPLLESAADVLKDLGEAAALDSAEAQTSLAACLSKLGRADSVAP